MDCCWKEVNEVWKGLGYYSRARRLFESAQLVMKQFDGALPQDVDGLMKVVGVDGFVRFMLTQLLI